jgi:hypothetical protein
MAGASRAAPARAQARALKQAHPGAEAREVEFARRIDARTRRDAAIGLSALAAAALALCLLAGAAAALSPLPRSDYTVRAACAAPSPGRATCLALQLVPQSAEARAHTHPLGVGSPTARRASAASEGAFGLTPADLHTAYQLPTTTTGEQTIALVDAYNDLTAESDLQRYDEELGLPACTSANGCFKKVNQHGESGPLTLPFPKTALELKTAEKGTLGQREEAAEAIGWGSEISLDIETAHAICQNCKILLVEANSSSYEDLEAAERAAELEAQEVSNSWGGPELGETPKLEGASPFNHPGTVITASAGDYGYLEWAADEPSHEASFPASSPHVVAVGGTRLALNAAGHTWQSESVWNDAGASKGIKEGYGADGGGCSAVFQAQPWQRSVAEWASVGCGEARAVADVAADADPYSGVAVYYSSRECESTHEGHVVHWCTYGGTSLSSPIIAASYALAGGAGEGEYPASALYANASLHPSALHDISSGSNGECPKPFNEETGLSGCTAAEEGASCAAHAICLSRGGYDGPSGVGTPKGISAFRAPTEAVSGEAEAPAGEASPPPTAPSPAAAPAGVPQAAPPPGGGALTPRITVLGLTPKTMIALNRRRPRVAQIGLVFNISTSAHVRISLAERHREHGHTTWHGLAASRMFPAASGRNSARLSARAPLAAGLYRLMLQPLGGVARSMLFRIG